MEVTPIKPQPSKPHSADSDNSSKRELISEWVVRFALNADKPLNARDQAVLCSTWEDGFADVDTSRLRAALIECLRSHTFKTIPTIGDIRQHLKNAERRAAEEEAEQKWQKVLAYAERLSPDLPDRNPPRISQRTRRAINAAGGLDYLCDCNRESLQWARKRFIEEYIRYGELQQDEYLLLAGKERELLDGCAEQKRLPGADAYEAARVIGESDRECLVKCSTEARQVAASPKEAEPRPVTATSERLELLKRQKAELLAKSSPEQIRRAEQLRSMCTRCTR